MIKADRNIKVVAFDADDTLWDNERFFREGEAKLCELLAGYAPPEKVIGHLYEEEIRTLHIYGYGIKSYVLSMIETAVDISGGRVKPETIKQILGIGKWQLERPVEVYEGVVHVLSALEGRYELVLATKGDLLDQRRKIAASGLASHFGHIEIMSDKKVADYKRLLERVGCSPDNFLMIGNSIKSDILPVLDLGGHAVHVPCDVTWVHETVESDPVHPRFIRLDRIYDLLDYLL